MKRYKKLQEVIQKLEKQDRLLELAKDDAYEEYNSTKIHARKVEIAHYLDKLREQQKEVGIHLRVNRANLTYTNGCSLELDCFNEPEYCMTIEFNDENIGRFTNWLNAMIEEVEHE